jgi:pyruvate-formate lyase-activating enzyme
VSFRQFDSGDFLMADSAPEGRNSGISMIPADQRPDIAYIDIVDACPLKCPTCTRGVRVMPNTSAKMNLETFRAVVGKIKREGYGRIGLFSWTEPFLVRDLQDYVAEVKKWDLPCLLSTTFSLRHIDNLEATLLAEPDLITVSVSGFDQATYQINHVGGDLGYVFANLERAAKIVKSNALATTITLRFLEFAHNAHQEDSLRAHAAALGIDFEIIPGAGDPFDPGERGEWTDDFVRKLIAAAPETSPETCGQICNLMFGQISIDCHGDVYTCCAYPTHPSLRIGRYLDLSADEILLRRWTHRFCKACNWPRSDATDGDKTRLYRAVAATFSPAVLPASAAAQSAA